MDSNNRSTLGAARGIDIHHHFLPPFFVETLAQSGHPDAEKLKVLRWSPKKALAMMDKVGVETAILSLSLPGVSFAGAAEPATLARQCNEYAARMITDYPGRFGAFASLPILDIEAALGEIKYALDTLKLEGVMMLSNIRGKYPGNSDFDPILAELNRRKAIVFLHPNRAPGPAFNEFVEFPHDVSRALASLTESGCLERYPRIRYILAYGGGTIPFIAARVTVVGMDVMGSFLKTMISYFRRDRTMKKMNYDLTASTDPYAWQALNEHAKAKRILMGSNYPWTSPEAFARQQAELKSFDGLDPSKLKLIERDNSLKLFSSTQSQWISSLESKT
jgi:predicted TIM-barrel fold metal-dependent hydrolase